MVDPSAESVLERLRMSPTRLPRAPVAGAGRAAGHQRLAEGHACVRCGQRARHAYVAGTDVGPRWLDLCQECSSWLRGHPS